MDDIVKALRMLANQLESGEADFEGMDVDHHIIAGPPRDGYKTYQATDHYTMRILYAIKNPAV